MRIKDSDTALTLAAGAWTCPEGVPMRQRRDWWLPYERERARAEAAEARAQELRWAEVAARCDAGSWKSRFEASRRKLKAAVEQAKEARHHEMRQLHRALLKANTENDTLCRLLDEAVRLHDGTRKLRALIAGPAALNRHALSKEFCRRIGWFKPDGGLKDMMARVTMLAMHKDGLITLPPPKWRQNRPGPIIFGPDTEPPPFPAPTTLDEVRPLDLRTVVHGSREGKLWNEFVARHHYLGDKTLVGTRMRYTVHDRDGPAARHARLQHRRVAARSARPLHRLDAAVAQKEPSPGGRQPAVPDPALDHHPQLGLAPARHLPPPATRGLGRAVQDKTGADRDVRRNTAPHRRRLPGFRLDPCRNHPGTRALRHAKPVRQAQKGHLAPAPAKRLETHAQSLKTTASYRHDRTVTREPSSFSNSSAPGAIQGLTVRGPCSFGFGVLASGPGEFRAPFLATSGLPAFSATEEQADHSQGLMRAITRPARPMNKPMLQRIMLFCAWANLASI